MNSRSKFYLSFILIITITILAGVFSYKILPTYANVTLQNAQETKAQLESELLILEQEISVKQKQLKQQKGQSVSISQDISILTAQISKAKKNISAQNLIIKKLGGEINHKDTQIQQLTNKMKNELSSLAQLIRRQREIENKSIVVLILSRDTISSAYSDINIFASIKNSIRTSIEEIKNIKNSTQIAKAVLENKKNKVIDTKNKLETTKKKVLLSEQAKQKLLSISKNKESKYKEILNEKARRKVEILSALFKLRDASAIPFSTALEYANLASSKTGVRPAFLLAILTQESNLGANQGSCYVTNFKTGDGIIIKSGKLVKRIMKPMNLSGRKGDTKDFLEITKELGRDPSKTVVSCPWTSGYGGAMGPSQFIPTTWQGIKDRVSSILNIKTPDPWNPKDAFMASALFLKDLGGGNNSYTAERNAACKYYSGKSCSNPRVKNAFYGNSVMAKATNIQKTMIDPLQN